MRHNILIEFLDNGAVLLSVGCKRFGFPSLGEALAEVVRYSVDPPGVTQEYATKYQWVVSADMPMPEEVRTAAYGRNSGLMGGGGIR